MAQIFPFQFVNVVIQDTESFVQSASVGIAILPEAEAAIDKILEPHDLNWSVWELGLSKSFSKGNLRPWAIIAFSKEYRLAGHLVSIRDNRRDFSFSAYSLSPHHSIERDGVPPVSIIFVVSKEVVGNLARRSPLFLSAWELLKNKPAEQNWLVLPDDPPGDIAATNSQDDDELFRSIV